MSASAVAEFLRRNPLFTEVPDKDLRTLAAVTKTESYRARDFIFMEGDAATGFYLVQSGRVKILRAARSAHGTLLGLDKVLRVLPGDLFPNLHAHVHLSLLGWVLPMVAGVAVRVYPMLLLAREPTGWPGRVQLWGLGLGVPAWCWDFWPAPRCWRPARSR